MAYIYPLGLTSTDFSDGTTSPGYSPELYLYGAHIVIPSSGTVTQLGVKCGKPTFSANLKLGLYTSSGTLVGQSTSSVADSSIAWRDSGAVSLSVSAGTYYVLCAAQLDTVQYGYDTSGNGSFATENYATAMQASETITGEGDTGVLYGVRLDFTAGGGGSIKRWPPQMQGGMRSLTGGMQ